MRIETHRSPPVIARPGPFAYTGIRHPGQSRGKSYSSFFSSFCLPLWLQPQISSLINPERLKPEYFESLINGIRITVLTTLCSLLPIRISVTKLPSAEAFRHRCGAWTSNPVDGFAPIGRFDSYTLPPPLLGVYPSNHSRNSLICSATASGPVPPWQFRLATAVA